MDRIDSPSTGFTDGRVPKSSPDEADAFLTSPDTLRARRQLVTYGIDQLLPLAETGSILGGYLQIRTFEVSGSGLMAVAIVSANNTQRVGQAMLTSDGSAAQWSATMARL